MRPTQSAISRLCRSSFGIVNQADRINGAMLCAAHDERKGQGYVYQLLMRDRCGRKERNVYLSSSSSGGLRGLAALCSDEGSPLLDHQGGGELNGHGVFEVLAHVCDLASNTRLGGRNHSLLTGDVTAGLPICHGLLSTHALSHDETVGVAHAF